MASNESGIEDDFGQNSDWIELTNTGTVAVDLTGWRLTDDFGNTVKWVFPARTLAPGGVLIVWASDRNRKLPGGDLHTNFKLSADGEYLGLYRPDGTLADAYASAFPPQVTDVSYGHPQSSPSTLLTQGAPGQVGVPASATDYTNNFTGWNSSIAPLANASWSATQTGVGFDSPGASYGTLISATGNLAAKMSGLQRTACLRVPFTLANAAAVTSLKLRMKYDDGFIAWINGTRVASNAAPATPLWNSLATANRDESLNNNWTEFAIPTGSVTLNTGTNVLAIHGFNVTSSSSDFLLLPELEATFSGVSSLPSAYFTAPTPGAPNGATGVVGPLLTEAVATLPRPTGTGASPPGVMTVRVTKTSGNIAPATVRLAWREMFNAETVVTMLDNGVSPDAVAGDGVYSASMPTSGVTAGQMIRWRYEAADVSGNLTRAPPYSDPLDSDSYYGTVAVNADELSSQLPVLHWFIDPANISAAGTRAGTRAAFYFLNRFYDNVEINLHGQSTSGFTKKSHNIDFNDGNRFVWSNTSPIKAKDINLLTNYADKSRVRNTIAHDTGRLTGTVHHFAFPVRVQQNAAFHGVWDMVEDGDDRLLERNGLDPDGAFYKMYNLLDNSTSNVEKKTRQEEDNSDLAALIDGLNPSTDLASRTAYAYDNVDLPATINYLVTRQLNSDSDHGHKNYYLYRDTNITREWQPVVWDVDLSWGHNWNGSEGYFDNDLVSNNPLNAGASGNRLYDLVYNSPEMRAMFLRRMRTVMDTILQPPGTVNGERETFARSIAAMIDPNPADPSAETDGDRDFTKWGSWNSPQLRPREELERVISGYLAPRRTFLFNTAAGTRPTLGGDPIPDTPQNVPPGGVFIDSLDFLPVSGNPAEEYIILRNTTGVAVDLTGWSLTGAIEHPFAPGTVLPAGAGTPAADYVGLLHVVKDAVAFRARATGPTGGQRRFIQGNYSGQLSARGEQLTLINTTGTVIHTFGYAGTPTAHQNGLRISELHYAPLPPTPAESAAIPGVVAGDFEFIELVNIGAAPLSLGGITFSQGITFTFPAGTVAPGARIIVARSPAAFAARYPGVTAVVYGPYDGQIDNSGERLELTDPIGENILDFQFKDGWYPSTSGASGHSLVNRDPAAIDHDDLGNAVSWAIGETAGGSPGAPDTVFAQAYLGWDNDHFTTLERDNPLISGPDADADADGRSNLLEYVFGTDPRVADAAPVARFEWGMVSGTPYPGMSFVRAARALDLTYELVAATEPGAAPATWTPVASVPHSIEAVDALTERVRLVDPTSTTRARTCYRIRVTYAP